MPKYTLCLIVLLALPLSGSAQEIAGHPGVWKSAGTRKASPAEIQALIAVPGPAIDRYSPRCRAIPPLWGQGTPADEAAGRLVEIGSPAIDSLLPTLDAKESWRRCLTAEILGRIGDSRAVPALLPRLLSDPDDNVRTSIAQSLTMLCDVRAEDALIQALQDKSTGVQWNAVQGLGLLKTPRAIATLISQFTLPADTTAPGYRSLQWRAEIASIALCTSGPEAFPRLLQILNQPATPPVDIPPLF